jgi:hypothetical protein
MRLVVENWFEYGPRDLEYCSLRGTKRGIRIRSYTIRGEKMKKKAVVDRIEAGNAVILVGEELDRMVVPLASLPEEMKAGDWLQVDVKDDRIVSAAMDRTVTYAAKQRIAEKIANLRRVKG